MANHCYVTLNYLAQLNSTLSGNPSFNNKSKGNIYWILEIPLLYRNPFPIVEQCSQNLQNLFLKRRVVWGKDGRNTDHWLYAAAIIWGFGIHGLDVLCLIGPDFIVERFSAFTSSPKKVKETHVAIKVCDRDWYEKGCWTMLSDSRIASINTRPGVFSLLIIFILPSVSR